MSLQKKETLILEISSLVAVVFVSLWFFLQMKTQELHLCQKAFRGLVKGSYGVQKFIDWEHLQAVGVDVGNTYSKFANQKEKVDYKKGFMRGFPLGFKQTGGKLKAFVNWRIFSQDAQKTIIAVDYTSKNKTLLFTVSKYPKKKIVAIQWK